MSALNILEEPEELPEFPAIPIRSQLYSLAPIGVGTGMVESLTSYIARLAAAHSLTLTTFVGKILAPLGKVKAITGVRGRYDMLRHAAPSLNGTGSTSADCAAILESLTLQPSLQDLTLRFTTGWLSERALLSTVQKWCPQCLNDWRLQGTTLYYPLLWQLQAVKSCPFHQTPLQSNCPECAARHRPLAKHLVLGRCPSCGGWLGSEGKMPADFVQDGKVRETCRFIAAQSMNLIAAAVTFKGRANSAWPTNIQYLVQRYARTAHRLSQYLGVDHDTVRCWMTAEHIPSLPSALMVACAFDLNVVDLLSMPMAGEVHLVRSLNTPEIACLFRRTLKRHDINLIEQTLIGAADHPAFPPLSLMAVCKQAGCHQSYAARKFPELAKKIIAQKQMYVRIHKEQRQYFAGLITKSVASRLAASGQYPSHRRLRGALPTWISLREPSAKKAWLETLEEWGWTRGMNESVN